MDIEKSMGKTATYAVMGVLLIAGLIHSVAVLADDCGVYERDMQTELAKRGYVGEAADGDYDCASENVANKVKLTVTVNGIKEIMYCDDKGCN